MGKWAAIYPVIMTLPSSVAGISGLEKTKKLSIYARQALERSAQRSGIEGYEPLKDSSGTPRPTAGLYWSLSHSSRCVAAVVAPYTVGIDIEEIRDVPDVLKNQVASEPEWQLAPVYDSELFFRYWTAKEAVLKAAGHGLPGLAGCRIANIYDQARIQLRYQGESWLVLQQRLPANESADLPTIMAAITSGRCDVVWQIVDAATK